MHGRAGGKAFIPGKFMSRSSTIFHTPLSLHCPAVVTVFISFLSEFVTDAIRVRRTWLSSPSSSSSAAAAGERHEGDMDGLRDAPHTCSHCACTHARTTRHTGGTQLMPITS